MTAKKKLLFSLLCLSLLIFCALALYGCKDNDDTFTISFKIGDEICQTAQVTDDAEISIPTPTEKKGYNFDGWYLDKDVWSKAFTSDSLSDGSISSDISVYAKFTAIEYHITYSTDGGTHTNPSSYTIEDAVSFSSAKKTGYSFIGWYSDASYSTKISSLPTDSTGNITLYAKFELCDYTISYENTKGADNSNATGYNINSDKITLSDISMPGYSFIGWYIGDDKITEITSDRAANITLTAHWNAINYSITYHNVDGADNTNPTSYTVDDLPIELKDLTKNDFVFLGWYTDENFSSKITEISSGTPEELNLYAKWGTFSSVTLYVDNEIWKTISIVDSSDYTVPFPTINDDLDGLWVDEYNNIYTDINGNGVVELSGDTQLYLVTFPEGYTPVLNADQLKNISLSGMYCLISNIDLTDTVWTPIGTQAAPFTGTFDGNGYKISNLKITAHTFDYVGLFGYNIGTIKNLTVENYTINGSLAAASSVFMGGLVAYNSGNIKNCTTTGSILRNANTRFYVGGLIGYNSEGEITASNSLSTIEISGAESCYIGGLIGYNNSGVISNSYFNGEIKCSTTQSSYAAALVAYNTGKITDCYTSGKVNASCITSNHYAYIFAGGLLGYNKNAAITRCRSSADVTATASNPVVLCEVYIGGLIGFNKDAAILTCYATGNESAEAHGTKCRNAYNYAGGLIGKSEGGSLRNCYATGSAYTYTTGSSNSTYVYSFTGGLVAINDGPVINCYATGAVNVTCDGGTCSEVYCIGGGLIASNSGNIEYCWASGTVKSEYKCSVVESVNAILGGLIGKNSSCSIKNCYSTSNVTNSQTETCYTAGLVAYASSTTVLNSYATGTLNSTSRNGENYVGGLIGSSSALTLENCFATGNIVASAYDWNYVGGLISSGFSNLISVTNCYYSSEQKITLNKNNAYVRGQEIAMANLKSEDWITTNLWADETDIWIFGSGYPKLNYDTIKES